MHQKFVICVVAAGLVLPGCSSRPRQFNPTLATATPDRAAFDAAYAECNSLLVQGKLDSNGRLA